MVLSQALIIRDPMNLGIELYWTLMDHKDFGVGFPWSKICENSLWGGDQKAGGILTELWGWRDLGIASDEEIERKEGGKVLESTWMITRPWKLMYCWWFRNPKQPPGMYKTRRKQWDKVPNNWCRISAINSIPWELMVGRWNVTSKWSLSRRYVHFPWG